MYLKSRFAFATIHRSFRLHQSQTVLLFCLGLITCIHSLPANLQIDPSSEGASVFEIGPSDGPVKVDLRKPFNFNDKLVYRIWVHRDGFLSLAPPPPSMRGYPLNRTATTLTSLRHRLISVFMARVGPSQPAKVRYRTVQRSDPTVSCRLRNTMSRLEQEIHVLFPLDKGFRIREMLVVNWEKLTFDKARRDETNTFEAVLVTDETDSFVIFNYIDMNWDRAPTTDGQSEYPYPLMGMADGRADYLLPLSGQPMANKVEESSNVATPGMWVVKTGKMRISGEFRNPDVKYALERLREIRDSLGFGTGSPDPCQLPATTPAPSPIRVTSTFKAPLAQRPKTCADLQCGSNAQCENVGDGVCCVCKRGFSGDGIVCTSHDKLILNGTLRIKINGKMTEGTLRLQATQSKKSHPLGSGFIRYIGTPESARIVQMLLPLYTTSLWYGAFQETNGVNAFELSGMKLRRFSQVNIQGIPQPLRIFQRVDGMNSDGYGKWETTVEGDFPPEALPKDRKITLNKQNSLFELTMREQDSMIEINSSAVLRGESRSYVVSWKEEITYMPSCIYKKPPAKMSLYYDRLYTMMPNPKEVFYMGYPTVRGGTPESNPCSYPKLRCPGEREICVSTDTSYRCDCERGFELSRERCVDVDECLTGKHNCDRNAICTNQPGQFLCSCKPGYVGDGLTCNRDSCLEHLCDRNAVCISRASSFKPYTCQCKPGFGGNGFSCRLLNKQEPCNCSPDATCVRPPGLQPYCVCKIGFVGDGTVCRKRNFPRTTTPPSNTCRDCNNFAKCVNGKCVCKEGLVKIGKRCVECAEKGGMDCSVSNALCKYDNKAGYYRCQCDLGEVGDPTKRCTKLRPSNCTNCDKNADCIGSDKCRCRPGFRDPIGNGRECIRECAQHCHSKALCGDDGRCRCLPGYKGDGVRSCVYNCDLCHAKANCNPGSGCVCQANYLGNGVDCFVDHKCTIDSQCGMNRECKLHKKWNANVRLCTCKPGYVEKNGNCVLEYPCRRVSTRCHANAICINEPSTYLPYTCQCKDGYIGDGLRCDLVVQLAILPASSFEVKEGDEVRFKCKILSGNIQSSTLEWSKMRSPIRSAVRINNNEANKFSELIILTARPEDSGHYVCKAGNVKVNAYLTVKRNVCNRKCHESAYCDTSTRQCTCYTGFRGDGTTSCIREVCSNFPTMCGKNAVCQSDVCVCKKNYVMKGKICERIPDCLTTVKCNANATCVNRNGEYKCRCNNGFTGDGTVCTKSELGCNLLNRCVKNAECVHFKATNKYDCRCMKGYFGSGKLKCSRRFECNSNSCGENAKCETHSRYDDRSNGIVNVGVCKCNDGFKMVSANGLDRCYKDVNLNTSMFLSQGSIIYRVPIVQTPEMKSTIWYSSAVASPIVIAVATDCNNRRVYWSTNNNGQIISALADNARDKKILASNMPQVEGLAVDWIAGNIFFTQPDSNPQKSVVGVMTRNGAHQRIIAKKNVTRPRAIAVDPMNGKVYWTDWDRKNPRIESANMDGTERKIVVDKLPNLPNGLVFDFATSRLCWALANKRTGQVNTTGIYCILPGLQRSPTRIFYEETGWPFALTYNDPTFYFTDWESKRLQSVTNGVRTEIKFSLRTISSKLYGISVLPPKCPAGQNGCSQTDNNYGGCKYLCLPVPGRGRVCTCPDKLPGCSPTI